jgi:hypothetical protein
LREKNWFLGWRITKKLGVDRAYVVARRVLLDGIAALQPHHAALTVVGAQAIYIRVGEADIAVAPTTNDGDISIDPQLLGDSPAIEKLLGDADFARKLDENGDPSVGIWILPSSKADGQGASVDLLMADGAAPPGGSRGARIAGHARGAIRRVRGLEAALTDSNRMPISAFEDGDSREFLIGVAGPAALLIAKVHKILDREREARRERPNRLKDKDALDVYRLLRGTRTEDMTERLRGALSNPRSAQVTREAIEAIPGLFTTRGATGIEMLLRATEHLTDPQEAAASLTALAGDVVRMTNRFLSAPSQSQFHR